MQTHPGDQCRSISRSYSKFLTGMLCIFASQWCAAETINIIGNQVISKQTIYDHVVLEMANGRFTVQANGDLIIKNSVINVNISSENPYFLNTQAGRAILKNNIVHVSTSGIVANAMLKPAYQLIQVTKGNMIIDGNELSVDNPFTIGLLSTATNATNGIRFARNAVKNFHSGIYLVNSDSADISDNTFDNVSYTNVFVNGHIGTLERNIFTFPGNLQNGDAIALVNADNITIADNIISSGAGYGVYLIGSNNVVIDNNKITDGKSYAIYVQSSTQAANAGYQFLPDSLKSAKLKYNDNANIVITNNYLALNRYGLAAGLVTGLNVTDNTFIQRFADANQRRFWTDNNNLLPVAMDVTWLNNQYKEAFTQEVPGNNHDSLQFVEFPRQGGVVLP